MTCAELGGAGQSARACYGGRSATAPIAPGVTIKFLTIKITH